MIKSRVDGEQGNTYNDTRSAEDLSAGAYESSGKCSEYQRHDGDFWEAYPSFWVGVHIPLIISVSHFDETINHLQLLNVSEHPCLHTKLSSSRDNGG